MTSCLVHNHSTFSLFLSRRKEARKSHISKAGFRAVCTFNHQNTKDLFHSWQLIVAALNDMFTFSKHYKLFACVNTETVDIGHRRALPDTLQVCMMYMIIFSLLCLQKCIPKFIISLCEASVVWVNEFKLETFEVSLMVHFYCNQFTFFNSSQNFTAGIRIYKECTMLPHFIALSLSQHAMDKR